MKTGDLVGGKYRLVRLLGQGMHGSVWEALNARTSKRVALKLLQRPTEEQARRLLSEARACGSLSHRNIVEVYDVGETETGEPFLVMQLLDGESLASCLDHHRRLAPQIAAQLARDVAHALDTAHKAQIIHRDLKPANIYLHRVGNGEAGATVKVVDFGISLLLCADTRVTLPGMIVGSPAYMSPEQFLMLQDLDHRTDIWSLGVCLFEMLAGVRPFLGKTIEELSGQVLNTTAPSVTSRFRHFDEGLANIVSQCLERDRSKRIGSAAELAERLDRHAHARSDAPIIIAPPANQTAPNGTVVMAAESIPMKTVAYQTRDSSADGAPRPAPWREKPLDAILTQTVAAFTAEGKAVEPAETQMEIPANTQKLSNPLLELPSGLSENRRPKRKFLILAAAFVMSIVCITSLVVATRALADNDASDAGRPVANEIAKTNEVIPPKASTAELPASEPPATNVKPEDTAPRPAMPTSRQIDVQNKESSKPELPKNPASKASPKPSPAAKPNGPGVSAPSPKPPIKKPPTKQSPFDTGF